MKSKKKPSVAVPVCGCHYCKTTGYERDVTVPRPDPTKKKR
jgi:hypothetical protein